MLNRERKSINAVKAGLILIGGISMLLWIQSKNINFKLNPEEVFAYIEPLAINYNFNPDAIFALALAESQLNPNFEKGDRRGIMLISEAAWKKTSSDPWNQAFDWKLNIDVTLQYLDYLRALHHEKLAFSRLLGLYLEGDKTKDPILRRILDGYYDVDK